MYEDRGLGEDYKVLVVELSCYRSTIFRVGVEVVG